MDDRKFVSQETWHFMVYFNIKGGLNFVIFVCTFSKFNKPCYNRVSPISPGHGGFWPYVAEIMQFAVRCCIFLLDKRTPSRSTWYTLHAPSQLQHLPVNHNTCIFPVIYNSNLKMFIPSICIDYLAILKRIQKLEFGSLTSFLEFNCKGPIFHFLSLNFEVSMYLAAQKD